MRHGLPQCVCAPQCGGAAGARPGPVCGTDGQTYKSLCRLRKRACRRRNKHLTVDYYGQCHSESMIWCRIFYNMTLLSKSFVFYWFCNPLWLCFKAPVPTSAVVQAGTAWSTSTSVLTVWSVPTLVHGLTRPGHHMMRDQCAALMATLMLRRAICRMSLAKLAGLYLSLIGDRANVSMLFSYDWGKCRGWWLTLTHRNLEYCKW